MNIKDIFTGQTVYYPRWGKRVTVLRVDKVHYEIFIQDKDGNKDVVFPAELKPVTGDSDMSADDILRREG